MSKFGEAVERYINEHSGTLFRRDTSTCNFMETRVRLALENLSMHPNWGRFYTADLEWWPSIENIDAIVDNASNVTLQRRIIFVKSPPTGDAYKDLQSVLEIGAQNITVLLQDDEGIEYLFAANSWGRVIRPLMNQELLPVFKDALARAQQQTNGVLPQWPHRWQG